LVEIARTPNKEKSKEGEKEKISMLSNRWIEHDVPLQITQWVSIFLPLKEGTRAA